MTASVNFHRLAKITGMLIDVQTFFSMFKADPIIENHYHNNFFISEKFFVCKFLLLTATFFAFRFYYLLEMISYQIVSVTIFSWEMQQQFQK